MNPSGTRMRRAIRCHCVRSLTDLPYLRAVPNTAVTVEIVFFGEITVIRGHCEPMVYRLLIGAHGTEVGDSAAHLRITRTIEEGTS